MIKKIVIAAFVIMCLILLGVWYTRPLPFAHFFPHAELVTEIQAYYKEPGGERIERRLTPDVPRFTSVMELLESTQYRRSLKTLFPGKGTRIRFGEETETWGLYLYTEEAIPFEGGLVQGLQFQVRNDALWPLMFENMSDDKIWLVSADEETAFLKNMAQILK